MQITEEAASLLATRKERFTTEPSHLQPRPRTRQNAHREAINNVLYIFHKAFSIDKLWSKAPHARKRLKEVDEHGRHEKVNKNKKVSSLKICQSEQRNKYLNLVKVKAEHSIKDIRFIYNFLGLI